MRVLSSPRCLARGRNHPLRHPSTRPLRDRVALLLAASSLALGGCQLSRPEGAFDPVYPEEQELNDPDAPAPMDVGDGDGQSVFADASVEATTDIYKGIVGTYLARFDERSTAVTQVGFGVGAISTRSVTSRFFLIRIEEKDGKLVSREQMCGQTHDSTCEMNCETSTKIFSDAAARIPKSRQIVRELGFNEATGSLTADAASTYLGYDATDSDRALPTAKSDPRVWPGSGPGREGFYMDLRITVQAFGAPSSVICQVNMVQELSLAWNVNVGTGTAGEFALHDARGLFTTVETKSAILDALAQPPDKKADCMGKGDAGDDAKTEVDRSFVRFVKTPLTTCPKLSELEQMVKPTLTPTAG